MSDQRERSTVSRRAVARADALLTGERLHVYPLIFLGLGLLTLVIATVGRAAEPSGGAMFPDFLAHWTGGRMLLDGNGDRLYEPAAQQALQRDAVGVGAQLSWFVSPPFVAAAYAPLALLPYLPSAIAWTVASVAAFAASLRWMGDWAPGLWAEHRARVIVGMAASYPVFEALGGGQDSAVSLLCWVGGVALLIRGREAAGGAVLGLALFKPQLVMLVPVVLVARRQWRALAAFSVVGGSLGGLSVLMVGTDGVRDWLAALASPLYADAVQGEQAWKMASLPALVRSLLPAGGVADGSVIVVSLALAAGFVWWLLRSTAQPALAIWAVTLTATVVLSPHLVLYDAVLLLPPALYAVDRFGSADARVAVAACFVVSWLVPIGQLAAGGRDWPLSALAGAWAAIPIAWLLWVLVRPRDQPAMSKGIPGRK